MTTEEQIREKIESFIEPISEYGAPDCQILVHKILSIKVPKKVAECPECKGNGAIYEDHIGLYYPEWSGCENCKGTGSITQEFTIKELIEGDYLK